MEEIVAAAVVGDAILASKSVPVSASPAILRVGTP